MKDLAAASVVITQQLQFGSFYLALHHWLAVVHQAQQWPSCASQQALIDACQKRASLWPALHILHSMLSSEVSCPSTTYDIPLELKLNPCSPDTSIQMYNVGKLSFPPRHAIDKCLSPEQLSRERHRQAISRKLSVSIPSGSYPSLDCSYLHLPALTVGIHRAKSPFLVSVSLTRTSAGEDLFTLELQSSTESTPLSMTYLVQSSRV